MTRLFRLAVVTALSTYALIVLGGITRISGSGMGCEDDWPLCQGKPYPPWNTLAIIEYSHRTVAALIGFLVLGTAIGAWRTRGTSRRTKIAAFASLGLVIFQAGLGAVTVQEELSADVVTAHLGTAMAFFAVTLLTPFSIALDRGWPEWLVRAGREPGLTRDARFILLARLGALVIFGLVLTGAYTSTSGAALACDSWPLCQGSQAIPDRTSKYTWIHLSHRTAALIGTAAVAAVVVAARRRPVSRDARRLAALAAGIIGVQILIGASYVMTDGSDWMSGLHLATATALWATMLAIVVVARRAPEGGSELSGARVGPRQPVGAAGATARAPLQMSANAGVGGRGPGVRERTDPRPRPRGHPAPGPWPVAGMALAVRYAPPALRLPDVQQLRNRFDDYLELTKPGILSLLLATTFGGMLVGAEEIPPLGLILATLLGGALAAGGANILNCYLDRDIDAEMGRTRRRATATGRVSPGAALRVGIAVSALAIVELGLLVNWLAAGLALAGNLYYVLVYTKWLKRTTPQNIVIGGAAGAVPPLVGWAAATGSLEPAAFVLFAIIYYWTPPHFWALALLKQGEYGRVSVPMLPVVAGEPETRRQILIYTVILTAVSLLLVPIHLGWLYLIGALLVNGVFVAMALRLYRTPSKRLARQLFFFSLWYLVLIFAAMIADRLIVG